MFKSHKKANKLKETLISKLKTNPENNYKSLSDQFIKISRSNFKEDIEDHIDSIKMVLKTKTKAEVKFYILLLQRDMLVIKKHQNKPDPHVIAYFLKKIIQRLCKILNPKGIQVGEKYKENCLKKYLLGTSNQNQEKQDQIFQKRFYILLKELFIYLWDKYSIQNPSLKIQIEKLSPILNSQEKESFFNYPEYYDESSEDEYKGIEERVQKKVEEKTIPQFNDWKLKDNNIQNKIQETQNEYSDQQIEKKIFEMHEIILNFKELFQSNEMDLDVIDIYLDNLTLEQEKKPELKEILRQVPKVGNPHLETIAQNVSNFYTEIQKMRTQFKQKKKSPEEFKDSVQQLVNLYNWFQPNPHQFTDDLSHTKISKGSLNEVDHIDSVKNEETSYTIQESQIKTNRNQPLNTDEDVIQEFELQKNMDSQPNEEDEDNPKFTQFDNFADEGIKFNDFHSIDDKSIKNDNQKNKLKYELDTIQEELEVSQSNFTNPNKMNNFPFVSDFSIKNPTLDQFTPLSKSSNLNQKNKQDFSKQQKITFQEKTKDNYEFDLENNKKKSTHDEFHNDDFDDFDDFDFKPESNIKTMNSERKPFKENVKQKTDLDFDIDQKPTSPDFKQFYESDKVQQREEEEINSKEQQLQEENISDQTDDPFPAGKFTFQNQDRNLNFENFGKKFKENSSKLEKSLHNIQKEENSPQNFSQNVSIIKERYNEENDADLIEKELRRNSKILRNPSQNLDLDTQVIENERFIKPNFNDSLEQSMVQKENIPNQPTQNYNTNYSKYINQTKNDSSNLQDTEYSQSRMETSRKIQNDKQENFDVLNEKIKYLQEEVIILNDRLKNSTIVQKKSRVEQYDQENENQIELKIIQRKNEGLIQQNDYLKKIVKQLQQEKLNDQKKSDEKSKVLNQLINQYEQYTKKLKKQLDESKSKNQEQSKLLDILNEWLGQYEDKIKELQIMFENLKQKKKIISEQNESKKENEFNEVKDSASEITMKKDINLISQKQAIFAIKMLEAQKKQNLDPMASFAIIKDNKPMSQSFNLYQAFYDKMKPKEMNFSLINPKIQVNWNKMKNKSIPIIHKSIDQNESIRDLILDEEMMKMFDEDEEENLLLPVNKKTSTALRPKMQNFQQNFDLKQYSLYKTPKYIMFLKASSLFDNSILFENEYLEIQCITEKINQGINYQVNLRLIFKPKFKDFSITTQYENHIDLQVQNNFDDKILIQEETQVIGFDIDKIQMRDFPRLNLNIRYDYDNFFDYVIPLPFTINKYCESVPITQWIMDEFNSKNTLRMSKIINWNIEIIERFDQIQEIFQNVCQLSENQILLYLIFNNKQEFLLEFQHVEENSLNLLVHSHQKSKILDDIVHWLEWILGND